VQIVKIGFVMVDTYLLYPPRHEPLDYQDHTRQNVEMKNAINQFARTQHTFEAY